TDEREHADGDRGNFPLPFRWYLPAHHWSGCACWYLPAHRWSGGAGADRRARAATVAISRGRQHLGAPPIGGRGVASARSCHHHRPLHGCPPFVCCGTRTDECRRLRRLLESARPVWMRWCNAVCGTRAHGISWSTAVSLDASAGMTWLSSAATSALSFRTAVSSSGLSGTGKRIR